MLVVPSRRNLDLVSYNFFFFLFFFFFSNEFGSCNTTTYYSCSLRGCNSYKYYNMYIAHIVNVHQCTFLSSFTHMALCYAEVQTGTALISSVNTWCACVCLCVCVCVCVRPPEENQTTNSPFIQLLLTSLYPFSLFVSFTASYMSSYLFFMSPCVSMSLGSVH